MIERVLRYFGLLGEMEYDEAHDDNVKYNVEQNVRAAESLKEAASKNLEANENLRSTIRQVKNRSFGDLEILFKKVGEGR